MEGICEVQLSNLIFPRPRELGSCQHLKDSSVSQLEQGALDRKATSRAERTLHVPS